MVGWHYELNECEGFSKLLEMMKDREAWPVLHGVARVGPDRLAEQQQEISHTEPAIGAIFTLKKLYNTGSSNMSNNHHSKTANI